jgi:hypothetical protein
MSGTNEYLSHKVATILDVKNNNNNFVLTGQSVKGKVLTFTGTEALYRPYGPQRE